MRKDSFIKVCPFLRDLGDSYLCVNDNDVVDVILDPLIDIEWSQDIMPVATDVEGCKTCLFTLEIKENEQLFCVSRQMFLSLDKREIFWRDIRDAFFLMNLDSESDKNPAIDFCSTCLYKVLLASSPAFQVKLSQEEKIKLGCSYILNRANDIYKTLIIMSDNYSGNEEFTHFFPSLLLVEGPRSL